MLNTCETKVQKGYCSMLNACEARTIQIAKKLLCLFNIPLKSLWKRKVIFCCKQENRVNSTSYVTTKTDATKHYSNQTYYGVSKCLLSMEEEDISETWTHNQLVLQLWEETGQASHSSEEEIRKGHWTCLEIYQNCWARVAGTRDS